MAGRVIFSESPLKQPFKWIWTLTPGALAALGSEVTDDTGRPLHPLDPGVLGSRGVVSCVGN
jgi:hypothetical protein